MRWILFACSCLVALATVAQAQTDPGKVFSLGLSTGYSHLYISPAISQPISKDGLYADLDIASPISKNFPLTVGAGITGSIYVGDKHVLVDDGSGVFVRDDLNSDVGVYTLEARTALPLHFGHDHGFFLNPCFGMGLVVDSYQIDQVQFVATGKPFYTYYHTAVAVGVRPSIEAGYYWPSAAAGVQVAYMASWGDFGRLGSRVQDIQAGIFLCFNLDLR